MKLSDYQKQEKLISYNITKLLQKTNYTDFYTLSVKSNYIDFLSVISKAHSFNTSGMLFIEKNWDYMKRAVEYFLRSSSRMDF